MIYLDANATTPLVPEAIAAMHEAMEHAWANPSSIHRPGQRARHLIETARTDVARLIGCNDRELIFTSGGTEAADLAIRGVLAATGNRVVVTSPLEHSAVRDVVKRLAETKTIEVIWLAHDDMGRVLVNDLRHVLETRGKDIALVSVMTANNETGVLQPIAQMAALCRAAKVAMHTDATQSVGRMPIDFATLGVDLLSCSAHKLHGPKGAGALAVRRGLALVSVLAGGPQERGRRAGTENVAGIAGFGAAACSAREWLAGNGATQGGDLRTLLEQLILQSDPYAHVNFKDADRLWNTTSMAFEGLEAEAILLALSERGLAASAGAACSSGSLEPSPILLAIGLPETMAHGSLRFSLSRTTTEAEIRQAAAIIAECVASVRTTSIHAVRTPTARA